jgi:hypothetical protein
MNQNSVRVLGEMGFYLSVYLIAIEQVKNIPEKVASCASGVVETPRNTIRREISNGRVAAH